MNKIKEKILNYFKWQNLVTNDIIVAEMPSNRFIAKKAFSTAWPSAVEAILIALIGAVDMMMVGNLGKEAISAVGITTQPKFIVLAVIISLNVGLTVLISRRKGQNDGQSANRYLRQSLLICISLSFILSFLGFYFAEDFLRFSGANDDYIGLAVQYFQIIMVGNFFYSISLTLTAAQRGAGNTKISMKTNLVANIVNLIFNFLLINGLFGFPKLGVQGAAIATAIGNIVALSIAISSILKKDSFIKLSIKDSWAINTDTIKDIFDISSTTLVEQIFLRIGFLMFAKSVASLGTTDFSAHQVCMNVMHITFAFGDGLQIAATTLVGQSLGAKRPDLAMVYSRLAQRVGLICGVLLCVLIILFKDNLMLLFIKDQAVLQAGALPMILLAITVLFQVPQVITIGSLRGAGDVRFVAVLMLVSVAIIRPIVTWILAIGLGFGLIGAWLAVFCDQITRYFLSKSRFKAAKWTRIEL